MFKVIVFVVVFLSWATDSRAIVNIESMRQEASQDGFLGQVELSVQGVSGNTRKKGARAGTRLQWREGKITQFVILRYAYGESAGSRDTNNSFFHARHIRQLTSVRAGEFYIQNETDEFARLSFRRLAGAGERYSLFKGRSHMRAFLGVGVFYAVEKLEDSPGTTDSGRDHFWRISSYLSFSRQLNDQVEFVNTTYYQPVVDRFSDYRILEEAALRISLAERLTLKLSLDLIHDSKPPQTVKKTDAIYSTGLEYRF